MDVFRTKSMLAGAVAVAALILSGCSGGAATTSESSTVAQPPDPQNLQQAYVSVVQQVLPSVVQITTGHDLGSGIVFDTKGDIVTNAHVVGQATNFQVRLADNSQAIPATLVGTYLPDDLAVIRLHHPPSSLHPAHFGDSASLQVGDIVMAMGNPLGLTGSVSDGIISATSRTVTEPTGGSSSPGATLPEAIQTSASINPGNSGGALVDLAGDVIGVPTLAALEPAGDGGGTAPAPGIGFAIPSNMVTNVAGQLIAHNGHVVNSHRAELGVHVITLVGETGQPDGMGVVSVVSGGPAAVAGIQAGEVITTVDKTPVHSASELAQVLARLQPAQTVPITLTTPQGGTRIVMVTLGELPGS
ncbi:MAG TPA: trypsin-like peptidase domain-containing protein [Pseudonocardiaceae bacterium]|nr:trypsin-like peptidase domain-containing protein [Pseudonocardiaceae bacterium]